MGVGMSFNTTEVPCKKRKLMETDIEHDSFTAEGNTFPRHATLTSDTQRKQELDSIKNADTGEDLYLEIFQKILLDIHDARTTMENAMASSILPDETKSNFPILQPFSGDKSSPAATGFLNSSEAEKACSKLNTSEAVKACSELNTSEAVKACSKLAEVHKYVMLAFDMRPEIVLHRAQVGGKEFALDILPDIAIKRILYYISLEDKKNLREVSKGLSERILLVDSQLIKWRVNLTSENHESVFHHLNRANTKQISNLRGFQLHFTVAPLLLQDEGSGGMQWHAQFRVLELWKNKVTSLQFCTDAVQQFSGIYFRNLAALKVKNNLAKPVTLNKERVIVFVARHAATLTHLNFEGVQAFLDFDFEVSGLQHLSLLKMQVQSILPLFNLAKNTKSLEIDSDIVRQFESQELYFPCLKILSLRNDAGLKILKRNSLHVQTLMYGGSYSEEHQTDVPFMLPFLNTFLFFFKSASHHQELVQHILMIRLLIASRGSLKQLIVSSVPHVEVFFPAVPMHKLKDFIASEMTSWCVNMIKLNASTLQLIVMGISDYPQEGDNEEIVWPMPKLRRIVLLTTWQDKRHFMELPFYFNLSTRYPHAKIILEQRSFNSYLKAYTNTKQGQINIDPYYMGFS